MDCEINLDEYETLEELYTLRSEVLDLLVDIDSKITEKEDEENE